jgi:GntR family transcriptional regulator
MQSLSGMYSFTETMRKLGKNPKVKILFFDIIPASLKVSKKLGLEEGEEVYELSRLRLADEEPIMIETSYLPVKYFPNLSKEDFEKNSMYGLFESKFQIFVTNAQESFKAVRVTAAEAPFLLDEVGAPAMRIERIAYSNGRTIEYTASLARGDKYIYTTQLN